MKNKRKLISKMEIYGKRIYLRNLEVRDISKRYISWLNDYKVNRFLSTRNQRQSYRTVKSYVSSFKRNTNKLLMGIFLRNNDKHIGNITFSCIDWENNFAIIGISIGDKRYWRKGYGYEALRCVKKLAFETFGLNKLEAGAAERNTVSIKLFKKAGFKIEARLRQRKRMEGDYIDCFLMGILNSDYIREKG